MADKNTTSNINLAAAEELPKAQSKFKEFVKKFMKRKTAVISLAFNLLGDGLRDTLDPKMN